MEHIEFVYTIGMTDEEVADRLDENHTGVLGLADDDEAYALPISYHFDGERFFLRLADDGDARKEQFVETTRAASFLVFDAATPADSWSVLATGPLERLDDDTFDDADVNRWFPPLRVFDEATGDIAIHLYALTPERLTGRRTVE